MQESSISEKIKELRTDLKMNQKNFSAAIGIRQSTLSSYENGVVTPSNDVLLTIAQKFHVSLDWLFGLSENKVQISTLSDILWVLLQMNESNELRYELDINNKLPGDIETETQKWYAGLRFYGNDPEHSLNADMCNFLADLQENRESLESYFTGKDMFDMWKKQTLEYYTTKPVTHKEIEELENYIFIQEEQYEDRIEFLFDLDESFHNILVPSLTLQPLIENSVVHGIGKYTEGGRVKLTTSYHEEEGAGYIMVEDNGVGIEEEKLQQIRQEMINYKGDSMKIGLGNVYSRLKILYGEKVSMDIESEERKGCKITIRIEGI